MTTGETGRLHAFLVCLCSIGLALSLTSCLGVAGSKQTANDTTTNSSAILQPDHKNDATVTTERASDQLGTVPGSIAFIGKVQNIDGSNTTLIMPNGEALPVIIDTTVTPLEVLAQVQPGQTVKAQAFAKKDGSFVSRTLDRVDSSGGSDQRIIDFIGMTTQTISSNDTLYFRVGARDFSATITAKTSFDDFGQAKNVKARQPIDVEIEYDGSNGTVISIASSDLVS